MHVIVGLGNPGRAYENTRHNVGFKAVDLLAEGHQIKLNKIKHKALVGEGFISGQKVLLVKPQTYMNLSGQSVREVLEYYKIDPENLLVLYDDIDIPSGRIRIRKKEVPVPITVCVPSSMISVPISFPGSGLESAGKLRWI